VTRTAAARVLAIFAPTVLLAAGWLWASARERDGLVRERQALMTRTADTVRAAVDESLAALRDREDQRPFYLYNHFYSPPDVLALADPLAISPLASAPDDARVLGYFQIDPGGVVRTPYDREPTKRSERGAQIAQVVASEAFGDMRALSGVADQRLDRELERYRTARQLPPGYDKAPREDPEQQAVDAKQLFAQKQQQGEEYPALQNTSPEDLGQYTVSLNAWSNQLYEDLKNVPQSSSPSSIPISTGRKTPRIQRKNVPSPEQQSVNFKKLGAKTGKKKRPSKKRPKSKETTLSLALENEAGLLDKPKPKAKNKARSANKRALPKPQKKKAPPPAPLPSREDLIADLGLPDGPEAVVEYSEMEFADVGGDLVLYRTVKHEGVTSVQGVLLDQTQVRESWLPSVVARYGVTNPPPTLVDRAGSPGCGLSLTASEVLPHAFLCFADESVDVALAGLDEDFRVQQALLAGLMLLALIAALAIERASRRAEELGQQKSAFISAISHELRTPLTTLRMNAEMLRDGMVGEDKRERMYGHMANESVRLSHLVENVLEISRLEEGRRPLRPTEVDLGELVDGVVASQGVLCEDKGFTLSATLPDGPLTLTCDRQAVEQVLINLVDNAVKYAGDGDEREVSIEVAPKESAIELHVLDRGPGVPEIDRAKVFDRFFRVERDGREHVVGTGLGLALVRDLARAHGGDVEVRDRAGGGADFVVTLPRATTA
jgi:signal transduction histidine kinase